MSRTKVYMGIPSVGTRSDHQCYVLREIERRYGDRIELVYPKDCVQRIFHDAARNGIVEDFLRSDCDILWFLDADIAPPVDVMELITDYGDQWDLAGLPYPVFMTTDAKADKKRAVVCVYKHDGIALKASEVPASGGVAFVDGLATGCMFIRKKIFQELQRPFFEFKYDPNTRAMTEGEDLGFVRKVNELGYKFFTDFGKVCGHYKTVNLLEVMNYASDYMQSYLDAYHAEVRPQIAKLAAQVEHLKGQKAPQKSSLILPNQGGLLSAPPKLPKF